MRDAGANGCADSKYKTAGIVLLYATFADAVVSASTKVIYAEQSKMLHKGFPCGAIQLCIVQ